MGNKSRDLSVDEVLIGGREKREIMITDSTRAGQRDSKPRAAGCGEPSGVRALRIEHIGSTAVAGLAAKGVIDLLVTADDPEDDTLTLPALTIMGHELRVREPGHRMFRTSARRPPARLGRCGPRSHPLPAVPRPAPLLR